MFTYPLDATCELRLLEQRHAQEWFELVEQDRPHMRAWLGWLDDFKTVQDAQNFIQIALNQFVASAGMKAGIWVEGKLAGGVSFQDVDWVNSVVTMGYWLSEPYKGRGIATRATIAMIDYAVYELKLNRLELRCAVENQKSRAIPERLGFVQEGVLHQSLRLYERYVDEVVYSMLAFEWQNSARENAIRYFGPPVPISTDSESLL